MSTFTALGLCEPLLRAIKDQGFDTPTPIQEKAIPHLMEGRDITGMAQTGGGKTAAFVLPMLNAIETEQLRFEHKAPIGVILAPTRELATQIGETVRMLARHTNVRHLVVSGGSPFKPQIKALERGVHILVATPGRLQDHVRRGNVNFNSTRFFMLDEADRMLDMGFIEEVKDIAKKLPTKHQTVMFSATMHKSIRKLSESLQQDPVRVEIQREVGVANTIQHRVMHVMRQDKTDLLEAVIEKEQPSLTLVFTRTKRDADKLAKDLDRAGHLVDALHGDKQQRVRQRILNSFKNKKINILVATDVAARGIDVKEIDLVVNYDMPLESENYIHRVGRTGRAGEKGLAVSFCSPGDMRLLVNVEGVLKKQIEVDDEHPWHREPNKSNHKTRDFGGRKQSHSRSKPNPKHAPAKKGKRFSKANDRFKSDDKSRQEEKYKAHVKPKQKPDDSFKHGERVKAHTKPYEKPKKKKKAQFKENTKTVRSEYSDKRDQVALQQLLDSNIDDTARRPKKRGKANDKKGKVKNKNRNNRGKNVGAPKPKGKRSTKQGGFAPIRRS